MVFMAGTGACLGEVIEAGTTIQIELQLASKLSHGFKSLILLEPKSDHDTRLTFSKCRAELPLALKTGLNRRIS